MQFNSKGKLAKFYMWLPPSDNKLPEDFCTYFWGLIGRTVLIFGGGGMLLFGFACALAIAARFLWAHKVSALAIIVMILVAFLAVWLSERKKKIEIGILSEAKAVIRTKVDAVKYRYCPRIEWR